MVSAGDEAGSLFVSVMAARSYALCVAGELQEAIESAWATIEHPDLAQHQPSYAVALSVLALAAAEQGRLTAARAHVDAAATIVRTACLRLDWAGGVAAVASAVVHRDEGNLAGAERDAVHAERIRRPQGACVELAETLVLLAEIRRRRGRLAEAGATLAEARDVLGELADAGPLEAGLASEELELTRAREAAAEGEPPDLPTGAELAVLRLMPADLSVRQIAGELFLSPNTVKTHARAIYRKLGVSSRIEAVARAGALGLLGSESPGVNEPPALPAGLDDGRLAAWSSARIALSSTESSTTISRPLSRA